MSVDPKSTFSNPKSTLEREIRGKIRLLLTYFIDEVRVFEVGIFVINSEAAGYVLGVAPDLVGDFEGGLVVGALEGEVLSGGDLTEDVAVLLLQTAKLLDELVLVEVELELGLDPVVEQAVSMWCVELRDVV